MSALSLGPAWRIASLCLLAGSAACETPSTGRRSADDPASTDVRPAGPGATAEAPTSAGGSPPQSPASPPVPSLPARPEEPTGPERACNQDGDCELVPDDCRHCPPCEPTWRVARNRREVQRIIAERKRIECPPISCEQCDVPGPTGYIGGSAVCLDGQCVVRE